MELADERDNSSFISIDSIEEMCMICFTNLYSMHELTCCKKKICTNCVKEWIKKQPINDNLCVFCKKPNYVFKYSYINLEQDEYSVCPAQCQAHWDCNYICTCIILCSMLITCAAVIYFFTFYLN